MRSGENAVKAKTDVGAKDYTVNVDTKLANQIGCAAEIAVCKLLQIEWSGNAFKTRKGGDAGEIEVRCSAGGRGHSLLLNERDRAKASRKFVYVESLGQRRFVVKGWAFGHEVMKPENLFTRPQFVETIWRMPTHRLRDPHQLLQKDCSNF